MRKRFTWISVLGFSFKDNKSRKYWYCKCRCGKMFDVQENHLYSGHTKSCGCLRNKRIENLNKTHGESRKTKEYSCWKNMKSRCYNPKSTFYKDYGGRGITVCDRWLYSYANFLKDMKRKPLENYSIDRIDVDGNYEPNNCRWTTAKIQANNKRRRI